MNEHAPAGDRLPLQPLTSPPARASSRRRRRRVQLRHEAAAVVAELRRMRRIGWSDAGDDATPRLAA